MFNKENKDQSLVADVNYCSIANNTATNYYCLYLKILGSIESSFQIKKSNIIENKATNTIYSQGQTNIIDSCILNNGNPCFFVQVKNMILIDCNTDNNKGEGYGSFIQKQTTNPFIVAMTFIETGNCHNFFNFGILKCKTKPWKSFPSKSVILFLCLFFLILNTIIVEYLIEKETNVEVKRPTTSNSSIFCMFKG